MGLSRNLWFVLLYPARVQGRNGVDHPFTPHATVPFFLLYPRIFVIGCRSKWLLPIVLSPLFLFTGVV